MANLAQPPLGLCVMVTYTARRRTCRRSVSTLFFPIPPQLASSCCCCCLQIVFKHKHRGRLLPPTLASVFHSIHTSDWLVATTANFHHLLLLLSFWPSLVLSDSSTDSLVDAMLRRLDKPRRQTECPRANFLTSDCVCMDEPLQFLSLSKASTTTVRVAQL